MEILNLVWSDPRLDFVRWYYRLFMATHREGTSLLCGCCVAGGLLLESEASKSFLKTALPAPEALGERIGRWVRSKCGVNDR